MHSRRCREAHAAPFRSGRSGGCARYHYGQAIRRLRNLPSRPGAAKVGGVARLSLVRSSNSGNLGEVAGAPGTSVAEQSGHADAGSTTMTLAATRMAICLVSMKTIYVAKNAIKENLDAAGGDGQRLLTEICDSDLRQGEGYQQLISKLPRTWRDILEAWPECEQAYNQFCQALGYYEEQRAAPQQDTSSAASAGGPDTAAGTSGPGAEAGQNLTGLWLGQELEVTRTVESVLWTELVLVALTGLFVMPVGNTLHQLLFQRDIPFAFLDEAMLASPVKTQALLAAVVASYTTGLFVTLAAKANPTRGNPFRCIRQMLLRELRTDDVEVQPWVVRGATDSDVRRLNQVVMRVLLPLRRHLFRTALLYGSVLTALTLGLRAAITAPGRVVFDNASLDPVVQEMRLAEVGIIAAMLVAGARVLTGPLSRVKRDKVAEEMAFEMMDSFGISYEELYSKRKAAFFGWDSKTRLEDSVVVQELLAQARHWNLRKRFDIAGGYNPFIAFCFFWNFLLIEATMYTGSLATAVICATLLDCAITGDPDYNWPYPWKQEQQQQQQQQQNS